MVDEEIKRNRIYEIETEFSAFRLNSVGWNRIRFVKTTVSTVVPTCQ